MRHRRPYIRAVAVVLLLALRPEVSAEEHRPFHGKFVCATPGAYLKTPEQGEEYSRWGLNCEYISVTKGSKREDVAQAVKNAHAAGFDVMCWNRTSLDHFLELFEGTRLDAFWFNEPGFSDRSLGGGYHKGGYRGYSDKSKAAFSEYLTGKYQPEEIRERFGIEKIENLELPRDGLDESVREGQKPNPKLWYEFVLWHNEHVLKQLRTTAQRVKEKMPGTQVVPCLSPCYLDAGPRYPGIDFVRIAREPLFDRIEVDPYVHIRMNQEYWVSYMVSLTRTACDGKPLHSWTNTWVGYQTEPIDMSQGVMAAFAQGVQGVSFWAYHHAPQARWKPDYKERWFQIRRALRFAHQHKELTELRIRNRAAIYFPTQCYYIKYFSAPWTKHGGVWGSAYFAERTYYSLVRAHVPADILIPPLGHEELIRDDLKRYDVLVAPEPSLLCDAEVEMLREWVRDGGLLLVTGSVGTHDQYGLPRETPALADVTGVNYGPAKPRKGIRIVEESPLLPSFKAKTLMRCEGWPVKQFLAIDSAKVTYEGAETHEKNMKTFRFGVDLLKEWKVEAPALEPSASAQVIGQWGDRSPAIVVNAFGKGQVVSCAAVDLTVAYELVGKEDKLRRNFLGDICRSRVRPFETDCPPGVEVNILSDRRRKAVTFFNQGYAPVDSFKFSLPAEKAPKRKRVSFVSFDQEQKLKCEFEDGQVSFTVPGFMDFALCWIE